MALLERNYVTYVPAQPEKPEVTGRIQALISLLRHQDGGWLDRLNYARALDEQLAAKVCPTTHLPMTPALRSLVFIEPDPRVLKFILTGLAKAEPVKPEATLPHLAFLAGKGDDALNAIVDEYLGESDITLRQKLERIPDRFGDSDQRIDALRATPGATHERPMSPAVVYECCAAIFYHFDQLSSWSEEAQQLALQFIGRCGNRIDGADVLISRWPAVVSEDLRFEVARTKVLGGGTVGEEISAYLSDPTLAQQLKGIELLELELEKAILVEETRPLIGQLDGIARKDSYSEVLRAAAVEALATNHVAHFDAIERLERFAVNESMPEAVQIAGCKGVTDVALHSRQPELMKRAYNTLLVASDGTVPEVREKASELVREHFLETAPSRAYSRLVATSTAKNRLKNLLGWLVPLD